MHRNQWVLKIAVLKYYSVSKRGTTAKSNPKQATDPISLHTKFGDNSSNTFPLMSGNHAWRRTSDAGHRTAEKAKIIYPPPRGRIHERSQVLDKSQLRFFSNLIFLAQLRFCLSWDSRKESQLRPKSQPSFESGPIKIGVTFCWD